jgi:hypothetical protein
MGAESLTIKKMAMSSSLPVSPVVSPSPDSEARRIQRNARRRKADAERRRAGKTGSPSLPIPPLLVTATVGDADREAREESDREDAEFIQRMLAATSAPSPLPVAKRSRHRSQSIHPATTQTTPSQ